MSRGVRTALLVAAVTCGAGSARAQDPIQPPAGLVSWWDAERTSTFDPVGGAFLLDVVDPSGCSARATTQPLLPVVTDLGKVGQAIRFDDTRRIESENGFASLYDGTNGFTVEFWMRADPNHPTGALTVLVEKGHDCGSGWGFQGDGVNLGFFVVPSAFPPAMPDPCPAVGTGTTFSVQAEGVFSGDRWYHIAGTYDPADTGQQVKMYVDGVLVGSGDTQGAAIGTNSRPLQAGNWWQGGRPYFGRLDELCYYSRALDPGEISDIVNAGSAGKLKPVFGERRLQSAAPVPAGTTNGFYDLVSMDGPVVAVGETSQFSTAGAVHVLRQDQGTSMWNDDALLLGSGAFNRRFGSGLVVQGDEILVGEGVGDTVWMYKYDAGHPAGPWVETVAFVLPSPSFGHRSERLARSGEVLLVGMPEVGAPPYPLSVGAATIWRRTAESSDPAVADVWTEEAYLPSPDGSHEGSFGYSVAIDGNYALVGAPRHDIGATDAGAVYAYVYDPSLGTWSREQDVFGNDIVLTSPTPDVQDHFGASLAMSTDSSGRLIALVGAGNADACGGVDGNQGAGYIFVHEASGWSLEAELFGTDGEAGFLTGGTFKTTQVGSGQYDCVALEGDVAILGSPSSAPVETTVARAGSVFVFRRVGTEWIDCERLFPWPQPSLIQVGSGVAISGNTVVAVPASDPRVFVFEEVCVPANLPPVASAGPDQVVDEGVPVVLDGTGSYDSDGDAIEFLWTQVGGTSLALDDPTSPTPSFYAPWVAPGGETLTFSLIVDDGQLSSEPDSVNITVTNVNAVPVAEAGPDQTLAEGSPVALDGSDSYDVDGDELSFTWTQVGGPPVGLVGANSANPGFTAPSVGAAGAELVFELVVSDGLASSAPDTVSVFVTNVNNPPIADAGPSQTVDETSSVQLDGSGSYDPDGDALSWSWMQVSGPPVTLVGSTTAVPSFIAPDVAGVQELVFELVVTDALGLQSSPATTTVNVRDTNAPPECGDAGPSIGLLWPPNHKMVEVGIVGVSDPDDDSITITILDVWQDEPVNGLGDGDTGPADAAILGDTVLLRAERSGLGDGRVYHVSFLAEDAAGNTCQGSVTIGVPHDKKDTPIDGGPLYSSTN